VAVGARAPEPIRDPRVGIVMATKDRRDDVLRTLDRLEALPGQPQIVVVDNASSDATAESVISEHPDVDVIPLRTNHGAVARTIGARALHTPYVAFSDDDSWWASDALGRAADLLDAHPRLALVAARILVGPAEELDATCRAMAEGPLVRRAGMPGVPVLGFVACGAVVRRSAFLSVGGFHPRFGVGGEEELCAIDLACEGWGLAYLDDVVAYHHPSPVRDVEERRRRVVRNALWATWLRRRRRGCWQRTKELIADARNDAAGRQGAAEAARGIPWVLTERRAVPPDLERHLLLLDQARRSVVTP
jgi:GT2 family glycosyltransferase